MLKIGHKVVRPGKVYGDDAVTIPVPEELVTVPGIPLNNREVDWYAREFPLESQNKSERAAGDWSTAIRDQHPEMREIRKEHYRLNHGLVMAGRLTAAMEPTAEASGEEVTDLIKDRARQLGYIEVGFTTYDARYEYKHKRGFTELPTAICLAYEQDFEPTQTIPSVDAEIVHMSVYRTQATAGLELGNFIRSLGYRAHVIHSNDATGPMIPMFVAAGLGQLGACGYLLTPHEGNRNRLMMITTDAKVTNDEPVDYGIHAFCQVCQVCVNRCPGRALVKEKVWWRGAEKNKLIYDRCRPVMARYEGCAVCMKVCPIQKYGMPAVMKHYVETDGEVLGKGTDNLEGYELRDKGYFSSGKLPQFNRQFFEIPHGRKDEWLFEEFKAKLESKDNDMLSTEEVMDFAVELKKILVDGNTTRGDE